MPQVPPAGYLLRAKDFGESPRAYLSAYARVPNCILQRDTRPLPDSRVKTAHREKTGSVRRP